MDQPGLPAIAAALMRLVMPSGLGDEVLEEMRVEYAERVRRQGVVRARLWVWRQVVGSVPGSVRRSWYRGMTGFESEADRMSGGARTFEAWLIDARFALRGVRARPQYMALAVLTLALGIGGTTAVFGIARAVLLDPLPLAASEELVAFWNPGDWSEAEVTLLRESWPGFAGVAAYRSEGVFLRREGAPARLIAGVASSAELFDVLGTRPLMGRGFEPGADAVGAEPAAVLSHGLWRELGGSAAMVGSLLELDGVPRRVVGVMPPGFWFPDPSVRVWLTTPMRPDNQTGNYALVGRLSPGRDVEGMGAAVGDVTTRLAERFTYPEQWDKTKNAELTPLRETLLGPVRPALLATLAAMGVILLMACANVATLMLAQLRGRESELAVRLALGAGRRRITQQLVVESLMLGLLAGTMGAFAAMASFRLLVSALPLGALAEVVSADWRLFVIALGISIFAAALISMAPVFSLWLGDLREALSRARSGGIGARGGRLEDALVVGEVALAVLLAATAAVLIRSVNNLYAVDAGVDTQGVAVIDVSVPGTLPPEQRRQQLAEMIAAIGVMPGVRSAGATQRLPLHSRGDNWGIAIEGKEDLPTSTTAYRLVTHDYFATMGIEVRSGRLFDASDRAGSEPVIVIDEALARRYFPGEDPLGRRIGSSAGLGWMRIIGVVENVAHTGLTDEPSPGRYMLFDQITAYTPESASLVLRAQPGREIAPVLQSAVSMIQRSMPGVAVQEANTMEQILATAMGPTRRVMQLMALLGGLALALGGIGVYGVVSHFVNRRRRDWVIRMALGLRPASVLRQVLSRAVLLVGAGCVLGLGASFALVRVFSSLLYEVSAADPAALLAAAGSLIATGCLAALLPGRRASRANPAAALRET